MKLKPEPLRARFEAIEIYLSDIKSIHDIIKEKAGSISISNQKYEFANWQDLIKNSKTLNNLSLTAFNHNLKIDIRFEVKEHSTYLDCSWGDKDATAHTFLQLSRIIRNCEIKRPLIFKLPLIALYNLSLIVWAIVGHGYIGNIAYYLMYILVFLLAIVSSSYINLKSAIHFYKKEDNLPFFKRKKDDIIIGVVIGAFFLALSLLISHYIKI